MCSAAVDEHRPHADLVQDPDLFNERIGLGRIGEYFTAGLDHKHLPLEKANIGRCVLERRYDDGAVAF